MSDDEWDEILDFAKEVAKDESKKLALFIKLSPIFILLAMIIVAFECILYKKGN